MVCKIVWIKAFKQMERIDRTIARRIYEKVDQLHLNPGRYVEKLFSYRFYRPRIGIFMIVLDVKSRMLSVLILKLVTGVHSLKT